MNTTNGQPWYLRERYAALLVLTVLAVVAAVLGLIARGDAGNEPLPEPESSSSSSSTT